MPRCSAALVRVDFINPLDFPGGDGMLPGAWAAAQATLQPKQGLAAKGVPAIYAADAALSRRHGPRPAANAITGVPGLPWAAMAIPQVSRKMLLASAAFFQIFSRAKVAGQRLQRCLQKLHKALLPVIFTAIIS